MRIAIFYSGYLPGEKYGGPVTSIYNFTELLGDIYEIYIICKNHDLKDITPYKNISEGWNLVGKAKVKYLSDNEYGKKIFEEIIDDINPDIIYASSIFSVGQTFPLLVLSRKKEIPLLLAPRGELNNTALNIKSTKKKIFIYFLRKMNYLSSVNFQATSEEERINIIQNLGIDENKVYLLPNIPTVPDHKVNIEKERNKLKICYVGRIVKNKNLLFALNSVIKVNCNILFDIYGPIEDKEYWEECKQLIDEKKENIIIKYMGTLSPFKIQEVYKKYDCLISPTFFENYGQTIVEAMLHDVPVIISKGTTPWNDISMKGAGYVFSLEKPIELIKIVENIGKMNCKQYEELIINLRKYCKRKFNLEELSNRYQEVVNTIAKK